MSRTALAVVLTFVALATSPVSPRAQEAAHPTDQGQITLADHGYLFVGGRYAAAENGDVMEGSMYVEHLKPAQVTRPFPIVMIHGGGQTGTNFTGTPDGRRGWAHDFLRAGYEVYVVDQPGRARSGQFEDAYGPATRNATTRIEQRFTAPRDFRLWPQAERHTRWPGSGRKGDPVFDQFYASQVASLSSGDKIEALNQAAGAALLDRIGPAIVMVHSQSGPFGWLIADARPQLVKGIVSIEPSGPPFTELDFKGAPDWFTYGDKPVRAWGVARVPLTYEPAVADASELKAVREERADGDGLARCQLQAEPARRLPHLAGIPIIIVASEASYHAAYDHCTAKYLTQAGVENEFVRLQEKGISGNGHMMMIEKN
ncbi:MAG TPA: alpha/beta hydrolase, partial [Geminicoccaceae bacterium]